MSDEQQPFITLPSDEAPFLTIGQVRLAPAGRVDRLVAASWKRRA